MQHHTGLCLRTGAETGILRHKFHRYVQREILAFLQKKKKKEVKMRSCFIRIMLIVSVSFVNPWRKSLGKKNGQFEKQSKTNHWKYLLHFYVCFCCLCSLFFFFSLTAFAGKMKSTRVQNLFKPGLVVLLLFLIKMEFKAFPASKHYSFFSSFLHLVYFKRSITQRLLRIRSSDENMTSKSEGCQCERVRQHRRGVTRMNGNCWSAREHLKKFGLRTPSAQLVW